MSPRPSLPRTMSLMTFQEKIIVLCGQKRWDQTDLKEAVGKVSISTVSNWFNGKRKPQWDVAPRVADALGLTLDQLMRDEVDLPAPEQSEAERQALDMVRELHLDKGEVIRRLAGQAATSRPLTMDEVHLRPRPRPEDAAGPQTGPAGSPAPAGVPTRRKGPKTGS